MTKRLSRNDLDDVLSRYAANGQLPLFPWWEFCRLIGPVGLYEHDFRHNRADSGDLDCEGGDE